MMKKFFAIALAACVALVACNKEIPAGTVITLTGSVDLGSVVTKVAPDLPLPAVGENITFHWEAGDKVLLLNPSTGDYSYFTCSSIDSSDPTKAEFTGEALDDMSSYIVGYACGDNCSIDLMTAFIKEDPLELDNVSGNHNIMITGSGNASGFAFTSDGFIDTIGLSLTGEDITLGSIKYYIGATSPELGTTLDFGTDGLELTSTAQDVWIPVYTPWISTSDHDSFILRFYDKENNLIMEKSTTKGGENLRNSTLVFFPELTVVEYYPGTELKGIKIGNVTWAPVNCGYDATNYPYGLLYQWGRKYGQAFEADTITPEELTKEQGEDSEYSGKLGMYNTTDYNWYSGGVDNTLWSAGSKGTFDPCPAGWRVPTSAELQALCAQNTDGWARVNSQNGSYFNGTNSCSSSTSGDKVFLPAAGYRDYSTGNATTRTIYGFYWTSSDKDNEAYFLKFGENLAGLIGGAYRAASFSVRCVK